MFEISEIFRIEPSREVDELIDIFIKMVKWWIMKAGDKPWKRYDQLRAAFYKDWVAEFKGWSSQLAHTSALEAYSRIKLGKPPEERAVAAELDLPIAVLHPQMIRIENHRLRIYERRDVGYIYVQLKPVNRIQAALLAQAENRLWKIGQVTISRRWTIIPFILEDISLRGLDIIEDLIGSEEQVNLAVNVIKSVT